MNGILCIVRLGVLSVVAARRGALEPTRVPSLFRFLVIAVLIAAAVYAAMLALVTFVQPQEREIIQTIPATKFK